MKTPAAVKTHEDDAGGRCRVNDAGSGADCGHVRFDAGARVAVKHFP